MIEDIIGRQISWAAAAIAIVILLLWGFNVKEDRDDAQEIRREIVEQCTRAENVERCADRIREAL